jgi:hypothetical protein
MVRSFTFGSQILLRTRTGLSWRVFRYLRNPLPDNPVYCGLIRFIQLAPRLAPAKTRVRYRFPSRVHNSFKMNGAQERTRTSTPLRELAPEASASANSATWALLAANYEAPTS